MSFQAPQAIFWGFQSGQIIQNLNFLPAAHIMGRVLLSSTARNVISSHLTWGVTWVRETQFGFRFCPEEAKKHWRFEKGSLRTELWFDKHFRFWNQITGRFDLSHYNDREIMIGLSAVFFFYFLRIVRFFYPKNFRRFAANFFLHFRQKSWNRYVFWLWMAAQRKFFTFLHPVYCKILRILPPKPENLT